MIEYLLEADNKKKKLVDLTCKGFADETASESPAPGGGSISAYMGALGAALGTMVANLSAHKPGWDARWHEFSDWADKGQKVMNELLFLVDEDTEAFNRIMGVFAMAEGHRGGEGCPQRRSSGGNPLRNAGSSAYDAYGLQGIRDREGDGRAGQPQFGNRCRCRCTGSPQRRDRSLPERED